MTPAQRRAKVRARIRGPRPMPTLQFQTRVLTQLDEIEQSVALLPRRIQIALQAHDATLQFHRRQNEALASEVMKLRAEVASAPEAPGRQVGSAREAEGAAVMIWPFKRKAPITRSAGESLGQRLMREQAAFRLRFKVGDRFEYLGRQLICCRAGHFYEGFVGHYYQEPPAFVPVLTCDYADELGVLHQVKFEGEELATLELCRVARGP